MGLELKAVCQIESDVERMGVIRLECRILTDIQTNAIKKSPLG
ncbi:hypothetical protein LEP1GSC195_1184 [Leptospira wolbachii serovar Codice str. CDC]|uniref:Uncharacterized protein n=1 Tax=Leptospira wolbachii serovar Codice str. CDC TaxID=1218599 RepID=R9A768_9LEPT|nr:hypothetical protein LEP1GSC195_1184 [Leptospira wolbachii serovar Codice str. CDC]